MDSPLSKSAGLKSAGNIGLLQTIPKLEARPKHKIMNFAFTLKDIEEMRIGVDVRAVFEQHIRDLLPSAKVMVRGYPGGGYNITAHVDMR
ncbi:hypothetical protein IQ22_04078 [Pseudomonas duriflava]|uniref:Uncharacterized protein n=1 Tax=Pseudomonas duriflava TaxID=459528 RepID=A0A562PYW0_9PSED|nr:hypothetical protein [Pseudomonas duriflava]TWI49276.1 hypothetical protein IQ22_04078 [Pseudomonas duriflava]